MAAIDCCLETSGGVRALIPRHGAGGAHGFQKQGIARGPAELRRAGMVEAMIEADGKGSGFMGRRSESCEHGPVPCPVPNSSSLAWIPS